VALRASKAGIPTRRLLQEISAVVQGNVLDNSLKNFHAGTF
jgi:hypothetical protein